MSFADRRSGGGLEKMPKTGVCILPVVGLQMRAAERADKDVGGKFKFAEKLDRDADGGLVNAANGGIEISAVGL